MKLYELSRDSYFMIPGSETGETYYLDHIDGMYSYCKDEQGNVLHVGAGTEVVEIIKEDWGIKRQFKVSFMRGDTYVVDSTSISRAIRKCHKDHPETISWDVLDVGRVM